MGSTRLLPHTLASDVSQCHYIDQRNHHPHQKYFSYLYFISICEVSCSKLHLIIQAGPEPAVRAVRAVGQAVPRLDQGGG